MKIIRFRSRLTLAIASILVLAGGGAAAAAVAVSPGQPCRSVGSTLRVRGGMTLQCVAPRSRQWVLIAPATVTATRTVMVTAERGPGKSMPGTALPIGIPEAPRAAIHVVCAVTGGNSRFWISFADAHGSRPPTQGGVEMVALGKTARDGWQQLPAPQGAQPGTVITSIDAISSVHGAVSSIMLQYDGEQSRSVPVGYSEDCSYAGFPSALASRRQ